MEYYNPTDNSSKRYALIITIVVMVLLGLLASLISIDIALRARDSYAVEIEYAEEEVQEEEQPKRSVAEVEQPKVTNPHPTPKQAYEEVSRENTRNQTSGKESETTTVNPNQLFKPSVGTTADEEVTHGNRLAAEGDNESHKGEGTGFNSLGDAQADSGLSSRGVRAGYPRPKGNNAVGKVVIDVVVDSDGNVMSASFRQKGSTTSDPELIANAIKAARNTKFNPDPARMTQSGTITYKYSIK